MTSTGLVHITTTTFTSVSSVSVDNCFSSSYNYYMIKSNYNGTDNPCRLRLRVAGSDASGANYARQVLSAGGTSIAGTRLSSETTWGGAFRRMQTSVTNFSEMWIAHPFNTYNTASWNTNSKASEALLDVETVYYIHDVETSYDGFSAILDGGTMTGTISVFGLALA